MSESWQTIEIAGHPVEVFAPAETGASLAVLCLPDRGWRASQSAALIEALRRHKLAAVAPAAECWWLDRVEPEFDAERSPVDLLRHRVVPWIGERFGIVPPRVRLLGTGTGGQGVLRLAYLHPREFPSVAAMDPAVDFHEWYGGGTSLDTLFPNREAARQATVTLRLHPLAWPRRQLLAADPAGIWFDGAERLASKLRSVGIPAETRFEESAGGETAAFFEQSVADAVAFLVEPDRGLPVLR